MLACGNTINIYSYKIVMELNFYKKLELGFSSIFRQLFFAIFDEFCQKWQKMKKLQLIFI